MKKLLIGAMMASLFMMGSDADAFSLFGKKSKSTSDISTSKKSTNTSASAPNLGTKKVGLLSKLTGTANKNKTANATIYTNQMGTYYEAPVAAICVESSGWASVLTDELKNNFFANNSERNASDIEAKKNMQTVQKAFSDIYKYMRKILKNEPLLTKTNAETIISQLQQSLVNLIGSKFWKYFGNHIRYSLLVIRNNLNMLMYPKEYWNVGALIFSSYDGTRGANGGANATNYHVGSLVYPDPTDAEVSPDSPILSLRDGITALIQDLVEAEAGKEAARQLKKQDRKARLSSTSSAASSSRALVNEYNEFSDGRDDEDTQPVRRTRSLNNINSVKQNRFEDTQEYGGNESIDEDAYNDAWASASGYRDVEDEDEDFTDPRPSGRYYR